MAAHRRIRQLAPIVALAACVAAPQVARAQTFVKITDPTNPLVTEPLPPLPAFASGSWIDVDHDGWDDYFSGGIGAMFRNLGGGVFTRVALPGNLNVIGNSWADYDNDGDADLLVSAGSPRGSRLFRNDAWVFNQIRSGTMADSLGLIGWGCAWGDYDGDGRVDAVIVNATGFTGTGPNKLLRNVGGDAFTRILT